MATLAIAEPQQLTTSFDSWKREGKGLIRSLVEAEEAHEISQWAIGDWLVKGEKDFNKKAYDAAEQITGWTRGTLYNVVSVVSRFPTLSLRSETKLRWSHFKELARITDDKKRVQVLEEFADGFEHSVLDVRSRVDAEIRKLAEGKDKRRPSRSNAFVNVQVSLKRAYREGIECLTEFRHTTSDKLLRKIVAEYLDRKDIKAEIQKAKARSKR